MYRRVDRTFSATETVWEIAATADGKVLWLLHSRLEVAPALAVPRNAGRRGTTVLFRGREMCNL